MQAARDFHVAGARGAPPFRIGSSAFGIILHWTNYSSDCCRQEFGHTPLRLLKYTDKDEHDETHSDDFDGLPGGTGFRPTTGRSAESCAAACAGAIHDGVRRWRSHTQ